MDVFVIQFFLAIMLFLIINWVGKQSYSIGYISMSLFVKADEAPAFNFLVRVLSPLVYLIIISALLYQIKLDQYVKHIYLVNIYYVLIRVAFNLLTNRGLLLNWVRQITYWIFIIGLSILIYEVLIKTRNNILPDFTTIANELWIIILIFLYTIINKMPQSSINTIKRKNNYLNSRFEHFKNQFGKIISDKVKNDKLQALVYSIIIFEDFNRPRVIRLFEYLWHYISSRKLTMGVMQVRSETYINDQQSVLIGIDLIQKFYLETLDQLKNEEVHEYFERYTFLPKLLEKYNGGSKYCKEVLELYDKILIQYFSKSKHQLLKNDH